MTTDPFSSPGTSSGVEWESLKGALLLIEPRSLETGIKTSFGDKDAIRADVVVLDGAKSGEVHRDTLVFPSVLIGQLRSRIDAKVLGRLGQGVAKPGQKPPWLLTDPTDADKATGLAWLAGNTLTAAEPPF